MAKRRLGILLLVSFLCAQTELYQFLKAPLLAIHFLEHKTLNASFSFGDFLEMHYFRKQVKDIDYERDMQLPFKAHSDKLFSVSSAPIPQPAVVRVNFQIIANKLRPFLPVRWFSITQSSIWHPPQLS